MSAEDIVSDVSTASEPVTDVTETAAPVDQGEIVTKDKDNNRQSIKEQLKDAFDKDKLKREPSAKRQEAAATRTRDETGKFAPETSTTPSAKVEAPKVEAASTEALQVPATAKPVEPVAAASTPASAPPTSWSQDAKATWASLPPAVQQAALKREKEVADGFAQYQTRYQDIDRAFGPQRDSQLQQLGKSRGQAVEQLFGWHDALANPQTRVQAFTALAQSHGIDLSTLAQAPQAQVDPNDPRPFVQQAVHPLYQKINQLEALLQQQEMVRTQADLAEFAKDKPHFEALRSKMAELFQGAAASQRKITLQEAYDEAMWGAPEIRQTLLAEQEAKRQADAKAAQEAAQAKAATDEAERKRKEKEAADKARRANVSPRASTPVGSMVSKPSGSKSARESILEAMKGASASI